MVALIIYDKLTNKTLDKLPDICYNMREDKRKEDTKMSYLKTMYLTPSQARALEHEGFILRMIGILSGVRDVYNIYTKGA